MQASEPRTVSPPGGSDESRYSALFQALREPIVVTTGSGQVFSLNPAARALFGAPASRFGQPIQALLPFLPELAEPLFADARWQGQLSDPAGELLDVEVTLARLGDDPDADLAFVLHDVSDHVERSRLREQLLENLAHELKGPVSLLENLLDIIADYYAEMSAEEFGLRIGQARRTSGQLHMLLDDLLSVGTIQAGQFTINPAPTPLADIVTAAVDLVGYMVNRHRQEIRVEPAPELLVNADARFARQVLVNLLTNASKYGPDRSVIRVSVEPGEGVARIEVADQGPGIAEEHRALLFDRFYRAPTTTAEPGAGLGLAIAKGIVEAHGGQIDVHSEPGAGTRAWFTLPLVEPRRANPARR
jgi:two-component system sensor histidine kinase ResE